MLHTRQDEPDVLLDLSVWNSIKGGDKQPTATVLVPLDRSSGGMSCKVANTDAVKHHASVRVRETGLLRTLM